MDLLNRRFVGRFEATYPQQPAAPRIGVSVITDIGRPAVRVNFLIDTGADHTLIAPRDARGLFGDEAYERINQAPDRTAIGGVGTGAAVVERELSLVLPPEAGSLLIMARDLWVAVELEDEQGRVVNRTIPSLLGRDILNHFTLTTSLPRGVIELSEEEGIPGSM